MSIVNVYLLSHHLDTAENGQFTSQKDFCKAFFQALCEKSEWLKRKQTYQTYVTEPIETGGPHVRGRLKKIGECRRCKNRGTKRPILGESDGNSKQRDRPPRTYYRCLTCEVPICKEGLCWKEFHKRVGQGIIECGVSTVGMQAV